MKHLIITVFLYLFIYLFIYLFRVMIATVNKECIPIEVQFFTNFMSEPAELYDGK